jgi:phospholipid/cholesterol/gamma-HCH transport system substrate-binding protein
MILKISREFKTGIVAVIVIGLSIWGYNYMKGLNLFDAPARTFNTVYSNVQGLNNASVVTINGVNVGKVINIQFSKEPSKIGKIVVEFSVNSDFEFSKNSVAKIYSASLMGGKSLAIVPSYEGEMAVSGDYLTGEIESDIFSTVSEKLNPLQGKVESVITNIDSLLLGLNDILDKKTRNNFKSTIAELNETVVNFKSVAKSADLLLAENRAKLDRTTTNIEEISENFVKISDSLSAIDIGHTIKEVEKTLDNLNGLLTSVQSGKGTLGKLMNDEAMYQNLTNSSKELEELLREMKLHPKRFVHFSLFGKKDKGYNPDAEPK